jgi:5-methylcytosine-specific restriction endonuclease McrA
MNNSNTIRHKRNVSESKKKYIASQQRWQCGNCNNLLDNTYEVDHIIPLYKGGSNELHNLTALCRNCHGVKTFKDKMGL